LIVAESVIAVAGRLLGQRRTQPSAALDLLQEAPDLPQRFL